MGRRVGLPRVVGGVPAGGSGVVPGGWVVAESVMLAPVAEGVDAPAVAAPVATDTAAASVAASAAEVAAATPAAVNAPVSGVVAAATVAGADALVSARRNGLPRTVGGAPSGGTGEVPEAYQVAQSVVLPSEDATAPAQAAVTESAETSATAVAAAAEETPAVSTPEVSTPAVSAPAVAVGTGVTAAEGAALSTRRNGLPRTVGGAASGGAGPVPEAYQVAESVTLAPEPGQTPAEPVVDTVPAVAEAQPAEVAAAPVTAPELAEAAPAATAPVATKPAAATATATKPAAAKVAAKKPQKPKKPKKQLSPETRALYVKMLISAVVGAVVAIAGVMLVRALMGTAPLQEFLTRYPGEYELPATAEPGFPRWVQWSHFLNAFFIVLIIRSGLQVRYQQKPDAYWTPKWAKGGEGKISLAAWFHQSLDVLWLVNGVVFVVLLFVTGHWMRIVPTSWEVFPNALSAILQYISLDWPTENGWVNYNSVQQIMYFLVVFVAAPLAALTGFRMSGLWPKKAEKLSRVYPVEVARAIHFPTMIFFVIFVIVHVVLVFSTGMLRNLNHMFGEGPTSSWVGFWFFVGSVAVTAAAWVAARPMILAMVARLFGKVSAR